MILKDYKIVDGKFCATNPLAARGFVMLKKELNKFFLIVEVQNDGEQMFVVCEDNVVCFNLCKKTTKIEIPFVPSVDKLVVFVPKLNLFASKVGTIECDKAYKKISEKPSKNMFQKIFGKVYDTYFYDSIKPKLARLFDLGKNADEFAFLGGKWTKVEFQGQEKIFGIIFKDKFAYAIAVGEEQNAQKPVANLIKVGGKLYNIVFMSAADGKYMQFCSGTLC